MEVVVEFLAQIRTAADRPEMRLEVAEGTTVLELVRALAATHGAAFAELALTGDGAPQPGLLLAVDGTRVAEPATHRLNAGARVLLGTAIAGG